jgi:polysaccharide biosynthesis protein PslH
MKILVVMTHYPFPPRDGSTIVAYNSIKHLSKHHSLDLICLEPKEGVLCAADYVQNLDTITHNKVSGIEMRALCLWGIIKGIPLSVYAFSSKQMQQKVQTALNGNSYDAILLFEMSAIQYCPSSCYKKLVINIEDPLSIKINRMSKLEIWSKQQKLKLFLTEKSTSRYERRYLPKLAKVLLLSEQDERDMREQGGHDNLAYMPYAVEFSSAAKVVSYENRERVIIFSGNMYHPPNIDALLFFLNEIFPLVLQKYKTAVFWIVGTNPDCRIYEAANRFGEHVVITGKVGSIKKYIESASVSVCPVRLKIGVQTKILEAFSLGTPVVSTTIGNIGIGGLSGLHLWVEDEPKKFAEKVVDLLEGNDWQRFSEAGINLVRKEFNWANSVSVLEREIQSVANPFL